MIFFHLILWIGLVYRFFSSFLNSLTLLQLFTTSTSHLCRVKWRPRFDKWQTFKAKHAIDKLVIPHSLTVFAMIFFSSFLSDCNIKMWKSKLECLFTFLFYDLQYITEKVSVLLGDLGCIARVSQRITWFLCGISYQWRKSNHGDRFWLLWCSLILLKLATDGLGK